ncbi:uncharacterized protein LOC103520827 [Diaphorina citri]|uniref:Uncharacterized protein LOC103520827 n=1 Tax=Diaphorina citri TaxID=121845 RepID=A0A3Q0JLF0_DIACI|nr:uncharacterized protein LOC103520827 [Diaphorina citri]
MDILVEVQIEQPRPKHSHQYREKQTEERIEYGEVMIKQGEEFETVEMNLDVGEEWKQTKLIVTLGLLGLLDRRLQGVHEIEPVLKNIDQFQVILQEVTRRLAEYHAECRVHLIHIHMTMESAMREKGFHDIGSVHILCELCDGNISSGRVGRDRG